MPAVFLHNFFEPGFFSGSNPPPPNKVEGGKLFLVFFCKQGRASYDQFERKVNQLPEASVKILLRAISWTTAKLTS